MVADNTASVCMQAPEFLYFFRRVSEAMLGWTQLQQACRVTGVEIIYTVIQSLTHDGRDRCRDRWQHHVRRAVCLCLSEQQPHQHSQHRQQQQHGRQVWHG